jgi:hypothetical protein
MRGGLALDAQGSGEFCTERHISGPYHQGKKGAIKGSREIEDRERRKTFIFYDSLVYI